MSDLAPDLAELLSQHRVVVCVGSGGVGKTTTSAALSVHAACHGRRVLCLTIDPARRLANSLGFSELDEHERVVDPALFAQHGLTCRGQLAAMMLDMKTTFDALVHRYASDPRQRDRILENRLYQYVSTSLAGTQEYMAMEKLHDVKADPRFDLIVLDTPPTTNALDFLEAPQKLVSAIDSPVMRWFVEALGNAKGASFLGKGASVVLRGLSRFTGAEFLELVGEFIVELNALFGGFKQRAQAVYDDLRGDDVAFVVVTSPDPATISEAMFFGQKLDAYDIAPKAVVVNRVHPEVPALSDPEGFAGGIAAAAGPGMAPALTKALGLAADDARAWAARDRAGVAQLMQTLGGQTRCVQVPALDGDVHDLRALARVASHLAGSSPEEP